MWHLSELDFIVDLLDLYLNGESYCLDCLNFQVDVQSNVLRKVQRNLDETMTQNDNLTVQVEHLQVRYGYNKVNVATHSALCQPDSISHNIVTFYSLLLATMNQVTQ